MIVDTQPIRIRHTVLDEKGAEIDYIDWGGILETDEYGNMNAIVRMIPNHQLVDIKITKRIS